MQIKPVFYTAETIEKTILPNLEGKAPITAATARFARDFYENKISIRSNDPAKLENRIATALCHKIIEGTQWGSFQRITSFMKNLFNNFNPLSAEFLQFNIASSAHLLASTLKETEQKNDVIHCIQDEIDLELIAYKLSEQLLKKRPNYDDFFLNKTIPQNFGPDEQEINQLSLVGRYKTIRTINDLEVAFEAAKEKHTNSYAALDNLCEKEKKHAIFTVLKELQKCENSLKQLKEMNTSASSSIEIFHPRSSYIINLKQEARAILSSFASYISHGSENSYGERTNPLEQLSLNDIVQLKNLFQRLVSKLDLQKDF